jgi:hypothetical protein
VRRGGRFGSGAPSVATSPLVFDLGINECPPLFFGRDDEMKGETACLACRLLIGIGFDDSVPLPVPPVTEEDSERIW